MRWRIASLMGLATLAAAQSSEEEAKAARYALAENFDRIDAQLGKEGLFYNEQYRAARRAYREGTSELKASRYAEAKLAFDSANETLSTVLPAARAEAADLQAKRQQKIPPPPTLIGRALRGALPAVREALAWLARHQDVLGAWDSDRFHKHDPPTDQCDGTGGEHYDVGVTSLALLAFLEAGYVDRGEGPAAHYALEVRRGLQWLVTQQDPGKLAAYCRRESPAFMYMHAIATLTMVRAFELTRDDVYGRSAERAIGYLLSARAERR